MPILKHIRIEYFKGFQHGPVELVDCGPINAIIGKNNSGKSSVLHAIDMAGLALSVRDWTPFQPKLQVKDLFSDAGPFKLTLTYDDGRAINVTATAQYGPTFSEGPTDDQRIKTILIQPELAQAFLRRRHRTPNQVLAYMDQRNYAELNALDMLYAVKFFGARGERGFTSESYEQVIGEVSRYFPEIEQIASDRTADDMSTLTYTEYGRSLDVLYSGTGLKHFLDVLVKSTLSQAQMILLDEPELGLHPDLQRQFLEYLDRYCQEKQVQVFLATHSPVLLNYASLVRVYRARNRGGRRTIESIPTRDLHTALSDLGIRPSDLFNVDICVLVEGRDDVIFWEHVVRTLYRESFGKIAIGVQQYAGGAAEAILTGAIDVSNITTVQKYALWIRDRDAPPSDDPAPNATRFKNKLEEAEFRCHILDRRELEFYYPEELHKTAQQGDKAKEDAALRIMRSEQREKYRDAAKEHGVCVPGGKYLRELLTTHLASSDHLAEELRNLVDETLIPWAHEVLGEASREDKPADDPAEQDQA